MPASNSRSTKARVQTSRAPGDVDKSIGRRMRERREQLGLTMETVATKLGLTIHQVQKYETGINRVGAARLLEISEVLEYPPLWFLTGRARAEGGKPSESAEVSRAELAELVQIFATRLDDKGRLAVLEFAKHLASLGR